MRATRGDPACPDWEGEVFRACVNCEEHGEMMAVRYGTALNWECPSCGWVEYEEVEPEERYDTNEERDADREDDYDPGWNVD